MLRPWRNDRTATDDGTTSEEDADDEFLAVAAELISAHAIATRQQAEVAALARDLERLSDRLAFVTQGSANRLAKSILEHYDRSARSLRDGQRLLGEGTRLLARYAEIIGVVLPPAPPQAPARSTPPEE